MLNDDELRKLHTDGHTISSISRELNTTRPTVKRHMKYMGLTPNPAKFEKPTNFESIMGSDVVNQLNNKKWLHDRYTNLKSSRRIANEIGCGKKAVLTALRRHHIQIGKSGGAQRSDTYNIERSLCGMSKNAVGKINDLVWFKKHFIDDNWSAKKISDLLGISKRCVYKWSVRHKLKKSDSKKLEAIAEGYKESTGIDIRSDEACRKRMSGRRAVTIHTNKGGDILCHSSWEVQAARLLDEDSRVVSFEKDALRIPYLFDGRDKTYYPDFIVLLSNGIRIIIEVKADRLLNDSRVKAKLKALTRYANKNGYHHSIVGGKNKMRENDLHICLQKLFEAH